MIQQSRLFAGVAVVCAAFAPAAPSFAVDIGSLHCNDADGAPLMKGKPVAITGVVVGQFSSEKNARLYVQDATGAVNVFGSPKDCAAVGDSIKVTGAVAGYSGLTEVTGTKETPVAIEVLGHDARVPEPLRLTPAQVLATEDKGGCEPNESRLVVLDAVRIIMADGTAPGDSARFQDGVNYRLRSTAPDSGWVMMRVLSADGCGATRALAGAPIPHGAARVTGILSQFTGREKTHGGYQILPRGADDVRAAVASTPDVKKP